MTVPRSCFHVRRIICALYQSRARNVWRMLQHRTRTSRSSMLGSALQFPMDIRGVNNSLSFHMARAYGIGAATRQSSPINDLKPAAPLRPQQPDSFEPSSAQRLVAAKVAQPVNFDAAAAPINRTVSAGHALQLYTRAADRIEAAVGVHIGRSIDIRG